MVKSWSCGGKFILHVFVKLQAKQTIVLKQRDSAQKSICKFTRKLNVSILKQKIIMNN